jgi:hypothetical protein
MSFRSTCFRPKSQTAHGSARNGRCPSMPASKMDFPCVEFQFISYAVAVRGLTSPSAFASWCARVAATALFAFVSAALTVFAQTSSAQDEAMPLLRDVPRVALRNVRIIDGTGAPARQNQTLIIEGGRIRAVGGTAETAIPEGTRTLDLDGRTVLPGFVMLHEHMSGGPVDGVTSPQPFSSPRLYLAFGVTTIRTAGTDHPYVELNLGRCQGRKCI